MEGQGYFLGPESDFESGAEPKKQQPVRATRRATPEEAIEILEIIGTAAEVADDPDLILDLEPGENVDIPQIDKEAPTG
ncbi:MAG: hypothetical protein R3313_00460 [Candidatus Saccharimonadales bacterium]|nr:hypothetical protein [Candidatus Saccharimonadales bacterium]